MKGLLKGMMLCLLLMAVFAFKQEDIEHGDLVKINQAYLDLKELNQSIKYEYFDSYTANEASQVEEGIIRFKGEAKYTKLAHVENLQTATYSLMVDHQKKLVLMAPSRNNNQTNDVKTLIKQLQANIQLCEQVKLVMIDEKTKQYQLVFPQGQSQYAKVYVNYSSENYLVTSMELFFADTQQLEEQEIKELPRMKVSYGDIKDKSILNKNVFEYESFVSKGEGKTEGKGAYADYQVIDQIN